MTRAVRYFTVLVRTVPYEYRIVRVSYEYHSIQSSHSYQPVKETFEADGSERESGIVRVLYYHSRNTKQAVISAVNASHAIALALDEYEYWYSVLVLVLYWYCTL